MNEHESEKVDLAIVGAGPIGIELAVAARRAGLHAVLFDAGNVGNTIYRWPAQTRWFSSNDRIAIAGVPLVTPDQSKATREQYLAYLRGVVEQFQLELRTYETVTDVRRDGDMLVVSSTARNWNRTTLARNVVLATGGTDHPRRLNIPGEDSPFVFNNLPDPHAFFRRRVLIVGGRNSAVESALRIHHAGGCVVLSYRKPALPEASIKYWLMPEIAHLIKSGRIEAHFETTPVRIDIGVATLGRADGSTFDVACDFVLKQIGFEHDKSLMQKIGVQLEGDALRPRFDEKTMQTNVPGVFVAGTATGGTQTRFRVFLENCHVHCDRILAAILGRPLELAEPVFDRPES